MNFLLLASIIISGTAADSVGCPPIAPAHEYQIWYCSVVREFVNKSIWPIAPGQPWSMQLTVSQPDTYSVRVWGENSKGFGCELVVVAQAHSPFLDVGTLWFPTTTPTDLFDLLGRRVHEVKPNTIYFTYGGTVWVDSQKRLWVKSLEIPTHRQPQHR